MSENKPRILVADDQADVVHALRLLLNGARLEVDTASSPEQVLRILGEHRVDALLMDLNYTRDTTSGREGMDLLVAVRQLDPDLPVIVMTAWGSVDGAVEAMRRGAKDYVEKPWDNARLVATIRTQLELGKAKRQSRRLADANRHRNELPMQEFVAQSKTMRPILDLMASVGPSDANVLITGEHGTGKEVVAKWLHASSPRASQPFLAVNAGGFSEGVFESELFGHVRGAFTDAKSDRAGCFELADQGTLFLDEIANVPLGQQAKLLRVLESREVQRVGSTRARKVDVRVLCATNADIEAAIADGDFREDLLYRLNTVEIHLPPLRERPEDLEALATRFLAREAMRYGKELDGFDADALEALRRHPWPGNVRELQHAVERAVLVAADVLVRSADLGLRAAGDRQLRFETLTLAEAERILVGKALDRHAGNVTQAARDLGLSRAALYRKVQRHGLTRT
ncbi:MAG: sigma-54-dependent Fis family transcriptional regulator [Gammaproteobacteria bacterium]|nr:sigma-54-dependent Fis family transcriptional regulator [Gammaproteobacteria bacterium]MYF27664.1 sigma-54-dependent Fis family transcriptional regulator [Gammaproteobacteria bacterium]MYK47372.1 sigma-54-dependent Fis family transcriptional regulator [Gammaproteobacteria bacterium]